jgi:hypothetical protein
MVLNVGSPKMFLNNPIFSWISYHGTNVSFDSPKAYWKTINVGVASFIEIRPHGKWN